MSSRDDILARVRKSQPAASPLPSVANFDRPATSLFETFEAALTRMGGRLVKAPADGDFDALIRRLFPDAKVICSATREVKGNRPIGQVKHPADLADVDVGVARAAFGVAETGSLWLSEREFGVNALGFLAQHLVVFLDPKRIVVNLHHAYQDRAAYDVRYGAFMTGPSATADIEGVLIHGAQGVRTLTVIPAAQ